MIPGSQVTPINLADEFRPRIKNHPARSIDTPFVVSATRWSWVSYAIEFTQIPPTGAGARIDLTINGVVDDTASFLNSLDILETVIGIVNLIGDVTPILNVSGWVGPGETVELVSTNFGVGPAGVTVEVATEVVF